MGTQEDQAAALLRAAEPSLLRLALLLTGERQAALDLTQETLARAWAARRGVLSAERPEAYLRAIMVNRARREGRSRRLLVLDRVQASPDSSEQLADRDELGRALRALPPRQRATVVLRHYEQLSEAETAELLRCSVGTVKSQTSKGLASLRAHLIDVRERTT